MSTEYPASQQPAFSPDKSMIRTSLWGAALFVGLILPLILHAYAGSQTRYISDDYCVAAQTESGIWETYAYFQQSWSGRYSYFLLTAAIMTLGAGVYALVPPLLLILWWLALIWLAHEAFYRVRKRRNLRLSALVATLILYATVDGAPSVGQSLYWVTGAITYVLPLVGLTIYGALCLRLLHKPLPVGLLLSSAIVSGIGLFVLAGFSETNTVLQLACLSLAMITALIRAKGNIRRQWLVWLSIGLLMTVIGLLIVATAPGNEIRRAQFPPPLPIAEAIVRTIQVTLSFFASAVVYFAPIQLLLTLTVSGVLGYIIPIQGRRLSKAATRKLLAGTFIVGIALVGICIAPSVYTLSVAPPGRLYILPHLVIVCLTASWGYIMGRSLVRPGTAQTTARLKPVPSLIVFVLLAFGPIQSIRETLELLPALNAFVTEWDNADHAFRQQAVNSPNVRPAPLSENALYATALIGHPRDQSTSCRDAYYESLAHRIGSL